MPQYMVAVHHPDNYDPSLESEAMLREISALNKEMISANVRIIACGLSLPTLATSLRGQPDGGVLITDGLYLETKEHVAGFWILETADRDQAVAWASKAVVACRAPLEVRELLFRPPTSN
jgi:hypothetical protein